MPYIHSDPVLDAERYNADMDEQAKFEDIRYDVCYEKEIAANEINKS